MTLPSACLLKDTIKDIHVITRMGLSQGWIHQNIERFHHLWRKEYFKANTCYKRVKNWRSKGASIFPYRFLNLNIVRIVAWKKNEGEVLTFSRGLVFFKFPRFWFSSTLTLNIDLQTLGHVCTNFHELCSFFWREWISKIYDNYKWCHGIWVIDHTKSFC